MDVSNSAIASPADVAITSQPQPERRGDVTVRNMTHEDAEFAGRLNAEAFRGKITHAVGSNEQ